MTARLLPLSVHGTSSAPPAVVPIAYQYLIMPLCRSDAAVQLADSCVREFTYMISAPAPSFTDPGTDGAVISAVWPLELVNEPSWPAPFSALTMK